MITPYMKKLKQDIKDLKIHRAECIKENDPFMVKDLTEEISIIESRLNKLRNKA
jgi:hypothetical protein